MDRAPVAVVLVSGGLDSCVCVAEAARTCALALLHVNYGQRTEAREYQAFTAIADHYGVARRLIVDVTHLAAIGGSSLICSVASLAVARSWRRQRLPGFPLAPTTSV